MPSSRILTPARLTLHAVLINEHQRYGVVDAQQVRKLYGVNRTKRYVPEKAEMSQDKSSWYQTLATETKGTVSTGNRTRNTGAKR